MIVDDEGHRYVMLMSSLPRHAPGLEAERVPLSRLALEQRLTMLEEPDRETLRAIEAVLAPPSQDRPSTDEEVVERAEALLDALEDEDVRRLVERILEARTVVAALRRRARGEEAPERGLAWGAGSQLSRIRRHWSSEAFGLEGELPWLPELVRHYEAKALHALEEDLHALNRLMLDRASGGHAFDFLAVVVYVLRWHAVAAHTTRDEDESLAAFEAIVADGLDGWDGSADAGAAHV